MGLDPKDPNVFIKPAGVRGSPTMSADQLAKDAKANGVSDILTYTLGDLFPKPDEDKDIGHWMTQLRDAQAKNPAEPMFRMWSKRSYAPAGGTDGLRAAAAYHFTKDTGIGGVTAEDVRIGHGGKGTLFGMFRNLEKEKDRVVFVPGPGWPTNYDVFPDNTNFVQVPTDGRGLISPAMLTRFIAQYGAPRILLVNAPCNPTGENYTPEERETLLRVVKEHAPDTTVVFDDPYGKLDLSREPYDIHTVLKRGPVEAELYTKGKLAVVRTASKEWGMADSRVGWLVTKNRDLLTSLANSNASEMGGISGRSQDEVQAALHFGDPFIERTVAELKEKRGMLIEGVGKLKLAVMEDPKATIYGWIDFSGLKGKFVPMDAIRGTAANSKEFSDEERTAGGFAIKTPKDMMRYLAYAVGICPVQGTPFYAPKSELGEKDWHVRFTFCGEKKELAEGIQRMQTTEEKLRDPLQVVNGDKGRGRNPAD